MVHCDDNDPNTFTESVSGVNGIIAGYHQLPKKAAMDTSYYLEVVTGSDQGNKFPLAPGEQTIGRDRKNTICIGEDGRDVSRRHATLYVEAGNITITDNQSTNGTYINDVLQSESSLSIGDIIAFGDRGPRLKLISLDEHTISIESMFPEDQIPPALELDVYYRRINFEHSINRN
jgi:pSer/pThr/pTyr-binding forkhead associated (FHA) protein